MMRIVTSYTYIFVSKIFFYLDLGMFKVVKSINTETIISGIKALCLGEAKIAATTSNVVKRN